MTTEVKVPTLGESITEATLGQWLKKPGDAVKADEPVASLETDKVAVDVPSPVAGTMGEQLVEEGDTVAVGAAIARIERRRAGRRRKREPPPRSRPRSIRPAPARHPRPRAIRPPPEAEEEDEWQPDPVARRPPGRSRASSRPVEDQGHRQGRPADQGRRARCSQGAGGSRRTARRSRSTPPPPPPRRRKPAPPPPPAGTVLRRAA